MPRILDSFGITYDVRGYYLTSACPAANHAGDRSNQKAFSFDTKKGIWCCFSHHCNIDSGSDVIGLVRSIRDCSFIDAVKFLEDAIKDDLQDTELLLNVVAKKLNVETNFQISEDRIKFLDRSKLSYYLDKGFSKETLFKFEVGLWLRLGTFMHNCMVFPVRNETGKLVGFSGRTIVPEIDWEKFKIKTKWLHGNDYVQCKKGSFHAERILFNFHRAKKFKTIILVEGIADGLKLDMAGIDNWSAIFGTSLSLHQQKLLIENGIKNVCLAMDGDKAGRDAAKKIERLLQNYFNVKIIDLPDGKDPNDFSINELTSMFSGAINER